MNKFIRDNSNFLIEVRILNKKVINNIFNVNIGEEYYNKLLNKLKEDNDKTIVSQTKYCYENLTCICKDDKSSCYQESIQNYKQFKKKLVIVKNRKELDIKYFPAITEYQYNKVENITRFNIDENNIELIYIPSINSYQCIIRGNSIDTKLLDNYI